MKTGSGKCAEYDPATGIKYNAAALLRTFEVLRLTDTISPFLACCEFKALALIFEPERQDLLFL